MPSFREAKTIPARPFNVEPPLSDPELRAAVQKGPAAVIIVAALLLASGALVGFAVPRKATSIEPAIVIEVQPQPAPAPDRAKRLRAGHK